jgi:hypothetical protein
MILEENQMVQHHLQQKRQIYQMILRDPPGSNSLLYWKGTSITLQPKVHLQRPEELRLILIFCGSLIYSWRRISRASGRFWNDK